MYGFRLGFVQLLQFVCSGTRRPARGQQVRHVPGVGVVDLAYLLPEVLDVLSQRRHGARPSLVLGGKHLQRVVASRVNARLVAAHLLLQTLRARVQRAGPGVVVLPLAAAGRVQPARRGRCASMTRMWTRAGHGPCTGTARGVCPPRPWCTAF